MKAKLFIINFLIITNAYCQIDNKTGNNNTCNKLPVFPTLNLQHEKIRIYYSTIC